MKTKLKCITCILFVVLTTIFMGMTVSAASTFKIGTVTSDSSGNLHVPVVFESNTVEYLNDFTIYVEFNNNFYNYGKTNNLLTYTDSFGDPVDYGFFESNYNFAGNPGNQVILTWFLSNEQNKPVQLEKVDGDFGSVEVAEIILIPKPDVASDPGNITKQFKVASCETLDSTSADSSALNHESCASYIKFDVTGNLGGNSIEAIGIKVGDSEPIELKECYSTTYESGNNYENEKTTFVVNLVAAEPITKDIAIYGKDADTGNWVPLGINSDEYTQFSAMKSKEVTN